MNKQNMQPVMMALHHACSQMRIPSTNIGQLIQQLQLELSPYPPYGDLFMREILNQGLLTGKKEPDANKMYHMMANYYNQLAKTPEGNLIIQQSAPYLPLDIDAKQRIESDPYFTPFLSPRAGSGNYDTGASYSNPLIPPAQPESDSLDSSTSNINELYNGMKNFSIEEFPDSFTESMRHSTTLSKPTPHHDEAPFDNFHQWPLPLDAIGTSRGSIDSQSFIGVGTCSHSLESSPRPEGFHSDYYSSYYASPAETSEPREIYPSPVLQSSLNNSTDYGSEFEPYTSHPSTGSHQPPSTQPTSRSFLDQTDRRAPDVNQQQNATRKKRAQSMIDTQRFTIGSIIQFGEDDTPKVIPPMTPNSMTYSLASSKSTSSRGCASPSVYPRSTSPIEKPHHTFKISPTTAALKSHSSGGDNAYSFQHLRKGAGNPLAANPHLEDITQIEYYFLCDESKRPFEKCSHHPTVLIKPKERGTKLLQLWRHPACSHCTPLTSAEIANPIFIIKLRGQPEQKFPVNWNSFKPNKAK